MSFETKLRRLAKKLPESEVPSELHQRVLSRLPMRHSRQKGHFTMKMILIPALALVFGGGGGVLFVRSTQTHHVPSTAQRNGPITLHFVDEAGKSVPEAMVMLSSDQQRRSPAGNQLYSDPLGNVVVTDPQLTRFYATGDGIHATGEITVREGEQVVTLMEHPVHSVTGRFVDTQGKPLMGLKPELYVVDSQTTQGLMTDPQGRFIAWIVPGNEYRISLNTPGYRPFVRDNIRVEKGQKLALDTITLQAQ